MTTLSKPEANARLLAGRQAAGPDGFTNYFGTLHGSEPLVDASTPGCTLLLAPERDFHHVLFAAASPAGLAGALAGLPASGRFALNCLTKSGLAEYAVVLRDAGFALRETYHRMAGPLPRFPAVRTPTTFATADDLPWFRDNMPVLFNPMLDHLPGEADLAALVADNRLVVHREGGRIAGFFSFDVAGARAHLHYWWTAREAGPSVGLDVLIRGYHEIARRGVRLVHAWVNVVNERVIAVHRRFGLKPDGLLDFIHGREPS